MEDSLNHNVPMDLQKIHHRIIQHFTPRSGWCEDEGCPTCGEAERTIDQAIAEATQDYHQGQSATDPRVLREAYESGFIEGQRSGLANANSIARTQAAEAFQRGLQQGRASAPAPAPADNAVLREKYYDEVLEDCRVIGESNPQMNPGMNALRHLLKKRQ